ncbi:MAG: chloramphenicol resistance protein [Acutalibacteraceae bacterium]
MARDTIITSIREFLETCPVIQERIKLENLGEDTPEYCVETVPCNPVVKEYVDGSAKKQYLFVFAGREVFGDDIDNLTNSEFYESVAEWIEDQDCIGNLPQLGGKLEAQSLTVLTNGYVFANDETKARYQIQCRLTYYKP